MHKIRKIKFEKGSLPHTVGQEAITCIKCGKDFYQERTELSKHLTCVTCSSIFPASSQSQKGETMTPTQKGQQDLHYYRIDLTDKEIESLAWLTARGYWPSHAYDEMFLDPRKDNSWLIPESAAWSITELAESDPDAFLSCCGEPLLGKLTELSSFIIFSMVLCIV